MDDPYVYPGTSVLRNKRNIQDSDTLDRFERIAVTLRQAEGVPSGGFDAPHLKAIHHHLFQDVYDWAGEFRTVHMSKGDSVFQFPSFIDVGVGSVHEKIQKNDYLRNMSRDDFTAKAADIVGDLNYAHPFREGNGRTQLEYLEQLSERAGHPLDVSRLRGQGWIEASIAAHDQNLTPMQTALDYALVDRDKELEPGL